MPTTYSIAGSGRWPILSSLESDLRSIPGVLGTGLFLGMTDTVIVGTAEGIEERSASPPPPAGAVPR